MSNNEAIALDAILARFTTDSWIETATKDEFEHCVTLEKMGYIEFLTKDTDDGECIIRLLDKGYALEANYFEKKVACMELPPLPQIGFNAPQYKN